MLRRKPAPLRGTDNRTLPVQSCIVGFEQHFQQELPIRLVERYIMKISAGERDLNLNKKKKVKCSSNCKDLGLYLCRLDKSVVFIKAFLVLEQG